MISDELMEDFIDNYEEDNHGPEWYTIEDFKEAVSYLALTRDDGSAYYTVYGDETKTCAFSNPPPDGADGVLWWSK